MKLLVLGMLLTTLSLACSRAANIPLFKPTATPTASPTPTATSTPLPTPTPIPTPTPVPAARIEKGDHALSNGDWEQALVEFQTAQQAVGDAEIDSAASLGIGRTYLLSGNYREAVKVLETLIEEYPESPHLAQAFFLLGQSLSALDRHADAAQAYLDYLARRPGIIDAYILNLRGDALFAAADYTSAAADYRAAVQAPSLLDGITIELKIARAFALSGDYTTALGMYDDIYNRTTNANTRALIDLRKGQAYTVLGQMEQAYTAYLDAVNNYPSAYESYSALLALVQAGIPVNELNRGLVDYYAGEYGVALAAFDRYLQNNPADPGTARYFYGLANRALGGSQGAIAEWDKVILNYPDHPYWDEAWEQKAYTQWYFLDQFTLAIDTLLAFVDLVPTHPRAAEFLFDAAQVAERAGRLEQAAELWQRVTNLYPGYEQAQRALFLAGISQYRLGDHSAAYTTFQRLLDISTTMGDRAMAYLWIGKAQQAMDDESGARASWELAAAADPTGYYSERARDILRGQAPFTPPQAFDLAADRGGERLKAETWMRSTFGLPEDGDLSGLGSLADDPYFKRAAELWELGMYSEARSEFEQLRQMVETDPVATYRLANYLAEIGLYRSATLAARQVLDLASLDDAATLNAPIHFNRLRFGTYFADLIMPVAEKYNFHPLLLFSLIRQESLFESFVRSSAAASGLMQVIPTTGAEISRNLGWPPDYSDNDLYRPLVSITFGVNYLDKQRKTFDGDLYAALAAYNGGPGNAIEWKKLAQEDIDLFLEVIRFSETRNYIRGIYEIFSIYRRLYDRTP